MLDQYLPLALEPTCVRDALGTIALDDLPDPTPVNPLCLKGATPLLERLWRIALADIEKNIVQSDQGEYFGAGSSFGPVVYTRDISYSGVLGLNRLYPEMMKRSLQFTRWLRFNLGLRVSRLHKPEGIRAPWIVEDLSEREFKRKYNTNSYTRRTDDVVWLWAAADLLEHEGTHEDWEWLYETGAQCFEVFYDPFFDPIAGLYRGQASFIDIHYDTNPNSGYPQDWSISDCLLIQALSTNCLYYQGLRVMSAAADVVGDPAGAAAWAERADALRQAIREELRLPDGTLAYFRDKRGRLEEKSDALGSALAVLFGILTGDEAQRQLGRLPVTDAGVPLFQPFYPLDTFYHNNAAWPFVDTFFLWACEQADGTDRTAANLALLARTCRGGTFHEVVDLRDKSIRGSGSQLWTASAFINACLRAGLRVE